MDKQSDCQLLLFAIGPFRLGISIACVREVLRAVALSPVTESAGAVEGLLNLRGSIVSVVDVRRLLRLPGQPIRVSDYLVVVEDQQRTAAFRVDRAPVIRSVSHDQLNTREAPSAAELADSAARIDEDIVPIVNPARLLSSAVTDKALLST